MRLAFLSILVLISLSAGCAGHVRREKPNIVIILADDLGYGDLSCYGNEAFETPHLDALAASGLRLTDFHSSGAVCSPTRAGLMTGRYQQRCGVPAVINARNMRDQGMPLEETTFAEVLKRAGYATGIFGKWHLGYEPRFNPVEQGFDRFVGFVSGNVDYFSHVDQTGIADWWHGAELSPEEGYLTHLITQDSLEFIEANQDGPFCLYVAHGAPHYPYQGPDDEAERTVGGEFPSHGSREDRDVAYREMIEALDDSVGAIVAKLEELHLEKDTFVFFFSDNGPTRVGSAGELRGRKGTLWEGGHRVPAIAYWPGTIRPGTSDETMVSLDLFPTMLSVAEIDTPDGLEFDGIDLWPHLRDRVLLPKRTIYWEHGRQKALRRGRWKLVATVRPKGGVEPEVGLFDVDRDPGETENLAESQADLVEHLLEAVEYWRGEVKHSPVGIQ